MHVNLCMWTADLVLKQQYCPLKNTPSLNKRYLLFPWSIVCCHFQQQMTQKTNSAILKSGFGQTETPKNRAKAQETRPRWVGGRGEVEWKWEVESILCDLRSSAPTDEWGTGEGKGMGGWGFQLRKRSVLLSRFYFNSTRRVRGRHNLVWWLRLIQWVTQVCLWHKGATQPKPAITQTIIC